VDVMDKVYVAHYDNGESWEDHSHSYGDNVYINRVDCEKEILGNGYVLNERGTVYETPGDSYNNLDYATIVELTLIK
jgi:hypothetical protein